MTSRPYRMNKRADQMADTRRRIVEAAVRLHTTVGAANTSISAVADEAGVTRLTVYRHFPDQEDLLVACTAHWSALHPMPYHRSWPEIADLEERGRVALSEIYAYYQENKADLEQLLPDIELLPVSLQEEFAQQFTEMARALVQGSRRRGRPRQRLEAVAGHLVSFSTWWSLAVDQGLSNTEAVEMAVGFLASAGN